MALFSRRFLISANTQKRKRPSLHPETLRNSALWVTGMEDWAGTALDRVGKDQISISMSQLASRKTIRSGDTPPLRTFHQNLKPA